MNSVLVFTGLAGITVIVLFAVLWVLAVGWRYLPVKQRTSEFSFVTFAVLFVTPVPVGLGVGAMVYPAVVLYQDAGQLAWHLKSYAGSPELVLPSILVTIGLAYLVSHKLLPNRSGTEATVTHER